MKNGVLDIMGETPELKSYKDVRRGKAVKNRNHRQTLSGRRWITRVFTYLQITLGEFTPTVPYYKNIF